MPRPDSRMRATGNRTDLSTERAWGAAVRDRDATALRQTMSEANFTIDASVHRTGARVYTSPADAVVDLGLSAEKRRKAERMIGQIADDARSLLGVAKACREAGFEPHETREIIRRGQVVRQRLAKGKAAAEGTHAKHGGRAMVKRGGKWVPDTQARAGKAADSKGRRSATPDTAGHPEGRARFEALRKRAAAIGLTVQGQVGPSSDSKALDDLEARIADHEKAWAKHHPAEEGEEDAKAADFKPPEAPSAAPVPTKTPAPLVTPEEAALPAKATQTVKTKAEVYKQAEAAQKLQAQLLNEGQGIDQALGAVVYRLDQDASFGQVLTHTGGPMVVIAPLKGEKRANEKATEDYGGDWSRMTDIVRATVSVPSFDDIPDVMAKLRGLGVKVAAKPKNRFESPTPAGYRDLMMSVDYGGHIAELQIHVHSMLHAKEGPGHKLYEQIRKIEGKMSAEGRTEYTPAEWAEVDQANKASKMVYDKAWRDATQATEGPK